MTATNPTDVKRLRFIAWAVSVIATGIALGVFFLSDNAQLAHISFEHRAIAFIVGFSTTSFFLWVFFKDRKF